MLREFWSPSFKRQHMNYSNIKAFVLWRVPASKDHQVLLLQSQDQLVVVSKFATTLRPPSTVVAKNLKTTL